MNIYFLKQLCMYDFSLGYDDYKVEVE
jgi:hypothetical protein